MKTNFPALSGLQGMDDFLSRFDGKLSSRNEATSRKLAAWGDLLDLAGWCVALQLGGDRPWLNRLAERHLGELEKTAATWQDLLVILEMLPDETLLRKDAGMMIWTAAILTEPATAATTPLTRRESEVMAWLRRGKSSSEMAAILGCSTRTVEKHVENLYRKISVASRAAAILHQPGTR